MTYDPFKAIREFKLKSGKTGKYYSLKALEEAGLGKTSRMPVSLRVVLESVLRNCDGQRITEDAVKALAGWKPNGERTQELPFVLARIMLQDMAGFPALNDFAAMRAEAKRQNFDPTKIEPLVPVDLVVDHSVVVDVSDSANALRKNMEIEFERNGERYTFLKWAKAAFSGIRVVPPGNGICHQVNLEYLSRGVWERDGIYYPDSAVGTDSHTTMVNAIGVLAWGVGGIEAEAGMLGQPYYFLEPDVVGVHMSGKLNPGVTATDLVLTVTELLRKTNVVNKFVEYFGEGAASLTPTDRATVSNMSPDYGATCGFFAIDEKPTGSKDPYALRRAALGVIRMLVEGALQMPVDALVADAFTAFPAGKLADERGLRVTTVEASMDDLPMLDTASFDIVSQPVSTCYVPDISLVYREVARLLAPGGIFCAGANYQDHAEEMAKKYPDWVSMGGLPVAVEKGYAAAR